MDVCWLWSCLLPARPLVAPSTALEVLVSPPALALMILALATGQGWCAWRGELGSLKEACTSAAPSMPPGRLLTYCIGFLGTHDPLVSSRMYC